jgi:hypothetical protein
LIANIVDLSSRFIALAGDFSPKSSFELIAGSIPSQLKAVQKPISATGFEPSGLDKDRVL